METWCHLGGFSVVEVVGLIIHLLLINHRSNRRGLMINLFDMRHLQLLGDIINLTIDTMRGAFFNIGVLIFGG